jgi:hypothetical protein
VDGTCGRIGEEGECYRSLVGKPDEKRPLGGPRSRWVDNIRMDLVEIEWDGVYWVGLAQDRDRSRALANAVIILGNYRVATHLMGLV